MFLPADDKRFSEVQGSSRNTDLSDIRIAVVFRNQSLRNIRAHDMSVVRWLRVSEALSYIGFSVDVIVADGDEITRMGPNLRYVPNSRVDWGIYHVVKTLFHNGFDALSAYGGDEHPFILSKLGSVVGSKDDVEGVYFFGNHRERLFETQADIAKKSRYVTVLTRPSRDLWVREHHRNDNVLLVPTGVDRVIPSACRNPYNGFDESIAVFIGNFYTGKQREVNRLWQLRFNELGRSLKSRGVRLCVVGNGDSDLIDTRSVTYLGPVDHSRIWDYQYFADVGLVLAQGHLQHNESSKIYYYLRTGLPIVSESPVPNNHLISETNLGFISDFNDTGMMADMVESAVHTPWDKQTAIEFMIKNHTWDARVDTYKRLICQQLSQA